MGEEADEMEICEIYRRILPGINAGMDADATDAAGDDRCEDDCAFCPEQADCEFCDLFE